MRRSEAVLLARTTADELKRALRTLGRGKRPRAYYLSHLIRDDAVWRIRAKFGALAIDTQDRRREAFADVRVGSYRYDQVQEGGLADNSKEDESYDYVSLPFDSAGDGFRHGLWRLTDARYREAIDALLRRKSHELTYLNDNAPVPAFEPRRPIVDVAWRRLPEVDADYWRRYVARASDVPRRFPLIKDTHVEFQAHNCVRVFVSNEGSRIVQCFTYWSLECYLWLLSKRGDGVPWTFTHFVTDPRELPSPAELAREIRTTVAKMEMVAAAPPLNAFAGPVLLEPVPAGLLIHEALGHRLEGCRLLSSGEGRTFGGARGAQVLPPFLTLRDDPTIDRFEGRSLVGHYLYDDEGVPAENATLIEGGKLCDFLTSRACLGARHASNGHARAHYHQRPTSRMAVTILDAKAGLGDRAMKRALLEEMKRQNAPFGIRIIEAHGGETTTESYNFQAFLGEINFATRVHPDGREEVIRGVDFVGTPLHAVREIIAAGKRMVVDNSFCGAESGFIPVTTISPSLLLSHLEFQSKAETPYTQYVYPLPWERGAGRRPARRERRENGALFASKPSRRYPRRRGGMTRAPAPE
ncbi:MAG: metallopeptidase TldD-related protein [Planctomycetes bacterium]|nr:metallopeptidase TldD-related protein [Planctomycetota bacterium]